MTLVTTVERIPDYGVSKLKEHFFEVVYADKESSGRCSIHITVHERYSSLEDITFLSMSNVFELLEFCDNMGIDFKNIVQEIYDAVKENLMENSK